MKRPLLPLFLSVFFLKAFAADPKNEMVPAPSNLPAPKLEIAVVPNADYLTLKVGAYRVVIVPGDVTKQASSQALVVSHWPTAINDGGGIGGAVADATQETAFQEAAALMKEAGGALPRRQVFATKIPNKGSLPDANEWILNVIELKAMGEFGVMTEEEVDNMAFPLPQAGREMMKQIIRKHATAIAEYRQIEKANWLVAIQNRNLILGAFDKEMESMWSEATKRLGDEFKIIVNWDNVTESFANVLKVADEKGLTNISTGTLAYGIMGDLNAVQSIGAMLSGVAYHAAMTGQLDSSLPEKEIRIVLYARDSAESRASIRKAFEKNLVGLQWLEDSARYLAFWPKTKGFSFADLLRSVRGQKELASPSVAVEDQRPGFLKRCIRALTGSDKN